MTSQLELKEMLFFLFYAVTVAVLFTYVSYRYATSLLIGEGLSHNSSTGSCCVLCCCLVLFCSVDAVMSQEGEGGMFFSRPVTCSI